MGFLGFRRLNRRRSNSTATHFKYRIGHRHPGCSSMADQFRDTSEAWSEFHDWEGDTYYRAASRGHGVALGEGFPKSSSLGLLPRHGEALPSGN